MIFLKELDALKTQMLRKDQTIQMLKDEVQDKSSIKNFQLQLKKLKEENQAIRKEQQERELELYGAPNKGPGPGGPPPGPQVGLHELIKTQFRAMSSQFEAGLGQGFAALAKAPSPPPGKKHGVVGRFEEEGPSFEERLFEEKEKVLYLESGRKKLEEEKRSLVEKTAAQERELARWRAFKKSL
jgi:hypothetical protein